MTAGPVRAFRLPVAWRCAPRRASRLSLDAPPGCFESVSTTDVCSRAPAAKYALWRLPAGRRGLPRRRSASRSSARTASYGLRSRRDAGPPRGHPASSGSVLDGTSPASGRVATLVALSRGAEAVEQLSRLQDAPSLEPLTPLPRQEWGARERSRSPVADPAFPGCTSMRPASAGSRRLPPGKLGASTFAGTRPELRARWPAGAMAARVHRCSRTSTRPSTTRLRGRLQAACASTASADRCFNEHGPGPLEHPVPAQCVAGTTECSIDRRLSIEQPPKVRRVRGRGSPNPRRSLPGLLPRETSPRP
jgi:hypothetical protein